jgi:hypothetical protein
VSTGVVGVVCGVEETGVVDVVVDEVSDPPDGAGAGLVVGAGPGAGVGGRLGLGDGTEPRPVLAAQELEAVDPGVRARAGFEPTAAGGAA